MGLCLVNLRVTNGTQSACLQVLYNATLAEGVQALRNAGRIYEVASTQQADYVWVQVTDVKFGRLFSSHPLDQGLSQVTIFK